MSMPMTLTTAALLIAGSAPSIPGQARPAGIERTDLQRHDISIARHEVFQSRVAFAPGASFPRHRHPGEEIIYVLEGSIEYDVDGKPPSVLKSGDVLFVPYGVVHAAKNVGRTPAAELGTYVVNKGRPLVEIVK